MTQPDDLAVPAGDQTAAWSAVRARLAVDAPWLTAALFRAVPVAVEPGRVPVATADRWGRLYVNFTAEHTHGMARLAADVQAAVLNWVSGRAFDADWHAPLSDARFPAITAADAAAAAHAAAAGVAGLEPPPYGDDPLQGWRDWAAQTIGAAQVPWQQALGARARAVVTARRGHQAATFRRPARRQIPGVVLPARVAAAVDAVVIADISGSVAPHLGQVLGEVAAILSSVGVTSGSVTLLAVDDEVASTYVLRRTVPELVARPKHRTDLRPGFDAAARAVHGRPPGLIIVLTDGLTPWPEHRPATPVIVGVIGSAGRARQAAAEVPSWATVVHIHVEDLT